MSRKKSQTKKKTEGRLQIGDTVYFVTEHFYRSPDSVCASMEYIPVKGTVKRFITGRYKEARVDAVIDNCVTLYFFKVSNYGKSFFHNFEDALAAAIHATDEYDRVWSRITHKKLRRPWEKKGSE